MPEFSRCYHGLSCRFFKMKHNNPGNEEFQVARASDQLAEEKVILYLESRARVRVRVTC